MAVTVNDPDRADDSWVHLVAESVGKPAQEHAANAAADDGLTDGRSRDGLDGRIDRSKELRSRARCAIEISLKCRVDLDLRDPSNTKPRHLPKLLGELALDGGPTLAGGRLAIGFCFAAIKLGGKSFGHGSRNCWIKTVPKPPHQGNALVSGEIFDGEHACCHVVLSREASLGATRPPRAPYVALNASRFCCGASKKLRPASAASQPLPKPAPTAASAR